METLGLLETWNITAGVRILDVMLKAADVTLLKGTTICSGRYMIQIAGNRDAVETSIGTAVLSESNIAARFILSNVSGQVLEALKRQVPLAPGDALGLVESKKAVTCIAAADKAVKQATVTLGRLGIASGINGKSYMVVGGGVSAVEEAVEVTKAFLGKELVDAVVIPNPDPHLVHALVPASNTIACLS